MSFTTPPVAPSRDDGDNFDARVTAFLLYFATLVVELTAAETAFAAALTAAEAAAATATNSAAVNGTSTSAIPVGTGSKTFTTQTGKGFVKHMFVLVAATAAPGAWVHGQVTSYDSGTGQLVVAVGKSMGDGTYTSWNIGPSMPIVLNPIATVQQIWAGTDDTAVVTPSMLYAAMVPQPLTDAATIAVDLAAGINFTVTIAGNRKLGNPTNGKPGQSGTIEVRQDGSGNRTLVFDTAFRFFGPAPTASTTPGAIDKLTYYVNADGSVTITAGKGERAA